MTENEKETKPPLTQAANGAMMTGREYAERETLRKTKGIQEEKQMNYSDVLANARQCIGKYCKACPVCNGVACKNQIPGPGAKGVGDTAIRNYNKWADIRVNMDTLCENGTPRHPRGVVRPQLQVPLLRRPCGRGEPPLLRRLHRHDLQRRAGAGLRRERHRRLHRRRHQPRTS